MRKRTPPLYGRQAQDYRREAPAFQQVWQTDAQWAAAESFMLTGRYAGEHWRDECARLGHEPPCHNLAWHQVVTARQP
jgi:hypothetical protein